jgi:hypothetical protein
MADTIGVAVQQSDLPMIQFYYNGEPLAELQINRFRGTVYPAIFLFPPSHGSNGDQDRNLGVGVSMIFHENQFQQMSPHSRFGPLLLARGLV